MYKVMTHTYYVYHIPGKKIGCTTNLVKRMQDQGFTNYEILWQEDGNYEFGWIAGDKEIELQKQYGLPIDTIHYQVSRENRHKWDNSGKICSLTFEDRSKGGKIAGLKLKESGKLLEHIKLASKASLRKVKCKYCGKEAATFNHARWHGENCKHKKSL